MPQSSPSIPWCTRFAAPPPEQRPRTVAGMPSRWWKNPMGCTARWMTLPPPQVAIFCAKGECEPLWFSRPRQNSGLPIPPSATRAFARTRAGAKIQSSA